MVRLEQAELNAPLLGAGGEPIVKGADNDKPFTLRDLLITSSNHPEPDDKMVDTMRLYRLQEKLSPNAEEAVVLDETNLDDLKKRGHERWRGIPWLAGMLLTLLAREDSVAALREVPKDAVQG